MLVKNTWINNCHCYFDKILLFCSATLYLSTCFVAGSSVGIILPPDADSDVYDLLENILHGIVGQTPPKERRPVSGQEEEGLGGTISKKLVDGI